MKILISKSLLESMLINIQPFLEKKDLTDIKSHVYIEAKNDMVKLKATDGEIGVIMKTKDAIVDYEGEGTANGKQIFDIIRTLKDENIILELIENTITIKQNRSKFRIPIFNPNSFPKFPTITNRAKISFNSKNLIKNLKLISPTIDKNNPKFELNGALIDIKKDSTKLVGTDTRRLAIVTIENQNENELSIIIPKKAISEIKRLFTEDIDIDIYYNSTDIIIQNRNNLFFSRLINGKYPDYERVVPRDLKHSIILPKKEIKDAIKTITAISKDIKIIFNLNSIVFKSLSTENTEAETELQIDTSLYGFELNVNSRYIVDFLSEIESDNFEIILNELSNLPFILKDREFITVVMPITI